MDPEFAFPIRLPAPGSRHLLRGLHGQLKGAILDGRLRPGLRLPATRALAQACGVSRNTVVAAYDLLLSEGYVVARERGGTYVAQLLAPARAPAPQHGAPEADRRLAAFWRAPPLPPREAAPRVPRFDFRVGVPALSAFRADLWGRLTARTMRAMANAPVAYADPQGQHALREAIASHVSFARAVACHAGDVVVTAGAQQAFDLLARVLVTPGRTVVADVTPSHQFPLGHAMSAARRAALLAFAQARGAVIVEDDYDGEFRHGERPLDALQTLDRAESVCYVGTFSKSLFPTLRLGFVVAPPWARQALTLAKQCSDWHCAVTAQDTLAAFIAEGHLARHVRKMRRLYGARRQLLLDTLRADFSGRLDPVPCAAGLHLAALWAGRADPEPLAARARQQGIGVWTTQEYYLGPQDRAGLLFGFGAIDEADIAAGLKALRKLW
ncbi:GntR family transcriptional regulator [Cupriavidus basilensis OR16]|uniref:GntR family transcriptional regulator n=1 Tax=Cupriavidus basilensis OR16 TaxID=1127483 RepID=H1SHC6_9BURK|nr:PLP-dependent aminotransferase family protein [Cupriavidus basilensis]EHP38117.1 GntR family transcriptional regulator [Cupriavidus basilensis OR16]